MTITKTIHLGKGATLNVARLLEGRMLIVGMSGSGKSYLVRVLCEQVVEQIPTIILDREGEFATLREKHDVVLVGEGGEADTAIATAAKLARTLAELGVSAVINLYALSKQDKRKFVRIFLDALLSLPRKLWRPRIVVLDEAHEFCPESGRDAESKESVIRLMDSGRKQGIVGILCTQRFAKLSKDAASEASNVCIGKTGLDVDLRRASDSLGFSGKTEWPTLRQLSAGDWFGYGDAFEHAAGVVRFRGAPAVTTHPKAGQRHRLLAPAPSKAILKVAGDLKDLKKQVEEEASLLDTLRKENEQLKRDVKKGGAAAELDKLRTEVDFYRNRPRPTLSARDIEVEKRLGGVAAIDAATPLLQELSQQFASLGLTVNGAIRKILDQRRELTRPPPKTLPNGKDKSVTEQRNVAPAKSISRTPISFSPSDADVGTGGMRRMLVALAQHPDGLEAAAIGLFAHVASKGGTFSTYMGRLRSHGWVEKQGSLFVATEAGVAALGSFDPLPSGAELAEYWIDWAGGGGQSRLLRAVLDAGEAGIDKDAAAAEANLAGNAGTFSTYLGRLRTANLIESFRDNGKTRLRAAATLLGA